MAALVSAIEREPVRAYVPEWPWRPIAALLRVLPLRVMARVGRLRRAPGYSGRRAAVRMVSAS